MKFFLNHSIKNKLIAIILAVTVITIGIGFTFVLLNDINTYKKDMVSSTTTSAQLIGEYSVAPLTFRDQKEAKNVLEKIETLPSIITACVYDENGNLFASFQKVPDSDIPASIASEEKNFFEKDNLKIFCAIYYRENKYGTVYLKASTNLLRGKINEHIIVMVSLMIGLIILSYFVASKLQTSISRPILHLAHSIYKVTQEADYSLRVQKSGSDEIGLLYDSFNEMLTQLNRREEERNNAEKLLRESESQYRQIVDTAIEGIWAIGSDFKTIFVNARMVELLGYANMEIIGRPITDFMFKEDVPDHLRKMENRKRGLSEYYERRFRRKDGTTVWTLASATPVYDNENHFKGSFAMFANTTDLKKAEEEIRKFNQDLEKRVAYRTAQLETANKELESFAYSVSHDLRAPLRSIDGYSQILLEEYQEKVDEQGKNYLHRVRSAAQHMAQLIDDLLNLSRLSRSEMNIQYVNLSEICHRIADEFHNMQPERKVEFVIQEGISAEGDDHLLHIVLENLIGNAWKFTSKHSNAKIEFGMKQENGATVYFVRDNGAGFDMNYVQKLFGAFQRLHAITEFQGTGIGLATVQRIIHRHKGNVWAEGEVEKGATFYFSFPKGNEK